MAFKLKNLLPGLFSQTLDIGGGVTVDSSGNTVIPGNLTVQGTSFSDAGAQSITSVSATAFTVASTGVNYGLQIDESTTSAITGLKIKAAATGNGVALSALGGTNEGISITSKGTGAIVIKPGVDSANAVQFTMADGTTNVFSINTSSGKLICGTSIVFQPQTDQTTAFQFTKNDGTTSCLLIDSTNQRVAVGAISIVPTEALDVFGNINTRGDLKIGTHNISTDTTTGTQIATGATQKIGFYGTTPVVQPAASADVTGFAAGVGTASKSDSTWTGASGSSAYTVGGIVTRLKALGLLAP